MHVLEISAADDSVKYTLGSKRGKGSMDRHAFMKSTLQFTLKASQS